MKRVYLKKIRHKCSVANCGNKDVFYIGKTREISKGTYICEDCLARLYEYAKSGQEKLSYEMTDKRTIDKEEVSFVVSFEEAPVVVETVIEETPIEAAVNEPIDAEKIFEECKAIVHLFSLRKYARDKLGLKPDNTTTRDDIMKMIEEKLSG